MKSVFSVLLPLTLALPALAQDAAPDWEVMRDPAKEAVAAVAVFDSGVAIGVRCLKGGLGVVLSGLPPRGGDRRTLRLGFGDGPLRDETWISTVNPTVAVTEFPARLARRLREGGTINIVAPGAAEGGRNLRFVMELPVSTTAIDSVLTECGKPLVDPRDADIDVSGAPAMPAGMNWVRAPRPVYPREAYFDSIASGYAVMSCNTQNDGALSACEVESEHPMGSGFGRAALESMDRARVGWVENRSAPVGVRRIAFRVNFRT